MSCRTETDVILHHSREWLQNSSWTMERFAIDLLAPQLEAAGLIAPIEQHDDGAAYLKLRKAWGQRVARIFHGELTFPLEWKWHWINQIPSPYRDALVNELQAMAGYMSVPMPEIVPVKGVSAAKARMGVVLQEFGEYVAAAAGPAGDGHYSRDDCPLAIKETLAKGIEAVQAIIAELQAVATGSGQGLPVPAIELLRTRVLS